MPTQCAFSIVCGAIFSILHIIRIHPPRYIYTVWRIHLPYGIVLKQPRQGAITSLRRIALQRLAHVRMWL